MVRIEADAPSSTSWYEVWEAVNAISYMCVRSKGKGGKANKIGRRMLRSTPIPLSQLTDKCRLAW